MPSYRVFRDTDGPYLASAQADLHMPHLLAARIVIRTDRMDDRFFGLLKQIIKQEVFQ